MSNSPSKWYEFINHKELRRLRKALNDDVQTRVNISVSIILLIVSCFMSDIVSEFEPVLQVVFYLALCLIVVGIMLWPPIRQYYKLKKHCNVLVDGKDALNIFDEEIVYDVLVACEYFNALPTIPSNSLNVDIENFYRIEISYYVRSSIDKLLKLDSKIEEVMGLGEGKISPQRIENICKLLENLSNSSGIQLDDYRRCRFDGFYGKIKHKLESINK